MFTSCSLVYFIRTAATELNKRKHVEYEWSGGVALLPLYRTVLGGTHRGSIYELSLTLVTKRPTTV